MEGHQRHKNGTMFPVEVRLSACYIAGQKLYLGVARDVTERKRAEELEAADLGEREIDFDTRRPGARSGTTEFLAILRRRNGARKSSSSTSTPTTGFACE
ncbi:MAG: PAS domain S-box protein [Terriglobales bacterium]